MVGCNRVPNVSPPVFTPDVLLFFSDLVWAASAAAAPIVTSSTMPETASPYSVLSVLDPSELAAGLGAANISFHRPAAASPSALPAQAIPRHILQTGLTWPHAYKRHAGYIHSWLDANPEYEYSFFGDEHALRFVERHGTERERDAYRRILTGSQRADLFRIIFLKMAGGVYADLDEELRYPLRMLFGGKDMKGRKVPLSSSAVIGSFFPFEFLLYVPQHPILLSTARVMTDGILEQVGLLKNKSKHACYSPHTCIIRVTGPLGYTSGVGDATIKGGCGNRVRTPNPNQCAMNSRDPLLRKTFICSDDEGDVIHSWSCGFARHWDCRNSARKGRCPGKHYARAHQFFNIS